MELSSKDFLPIPIDEFVKGLPIPVDLYIKLGDEKFVMIAKAKTQSNVDQFKNFQNKEIKYLWVIKKDFHLIAQQSLSLAGIAVTKKDLDDSQKTALVSHAVGSLFRQMEHSGMNKEVYNNAQQVTESLVGLVESLKSLNGLFNGLGKFSDQVLSHSIAVSTLSVMIGEQLGFTKRLTLEKLAMGGLLHDIGMRALPPDLSAKAVSAMNPAEIQLLETHALRGKEILLQLGIVPDDIVSIVYEHHENPTGQGYPQKLRDLKTHPLAKITALADAYTDLTFANINFPTVKTPHDALMHIEHTQGLPFNKDAFRALKRLIEEDKKTNAA